MRFSHFSLLVLGSLAIASPTVSKRADAVSLLTDLYATVQIYTGAISKPPPLTYLPLHAGSRANSTYLDATLAPLSPSSSAEEKAAAVPEVGAQINLITAAVTATTNDLKALSPATKRRSVISMRTGVESSSLEKRQDVVTAVTALLAIILLEIFATLTAAIAILGGALLVVFTTPLTTSLPLLILAVEGVLDVVLGGVTVLLNTLLTALALALSGGLQT